VEDGEMERVIGDTSKLMADNHSAELSPTDQPVVPVPPFPEKKPRRYPFQKRLLHSSFRNSLLWPDSGLSNPGRSATAVTAATPATMAVDLATVITAGGQVAYLLAGKLRTRI